MMATRTPSPAQLEARARFAEMARNGSLNRKRQIATKKRASNPINRAPRGFVLADDYTIEVFNPRGIKPYDAVFMTTVGGAGEPKYDLTILKSATGGFLAATGSKVYADEFPTAAAAAAWLMDWYETNRRPAARRSNPAKKTVSQKISQLVHEGYPQKQAVAIALNEERSGKVKRNPQAKSVKSTSTANFAYCVEAKRSLGSAGSVFEMVAGFNTKAQAQNYVDAILASNPGVTLRIKTYK
jgi:hypothetical protein